MIPDDHRRGTAFATLAFLVLFGGDVLRNATGFVGWGVVCGVLAVVSAVVAWRHRAALRPVSRRGVALLVVLVASIAWSAYPGATALGLVLTLATLAGALAVASLLPWPLIVVALGRALRALVVASLLFELVVAVAVRRPFCPVYYSCGPDVPDAFYWSRDLLFEGGRIQGLQGNANLLAVVALLALIVTACEAASRSISRPVAVVGLGTAVLALALTRSATVGVVGVAVAVVLLVALLVRRAPDGRRGRIVLVALVAGAAAAVAALAARGPLLALAGRSDDLTGRLDIWSAVLDLGRERPVLGWGWVSYWVPWVAPFDGLADRNGVSYLQAHDAYLDVWFQLGWLGLALFALLLVGLVLRAWWWATDRRMLDAEHADRWTALDLLPLLLTTALLVHGLGESRLIMEWGAALLTVLVVVTRRDHLGWTEHDRPVAVTATDGRAGAPA